MGWFYCLPYKFLILFFNQIFDSVCPDARFHGLDLGSVIMTLMGRLSDRHSITQTSGDAILASKNLRPGPGASK